MILPLYALLLVAWGNVANALLATSAQLPGGSWSFVIAGVVLVALSLAAARGMSLDADALALRRNARRGALIGATLGASVALIGVWLLLTMGSVVVGQPILYAPLSDVTSTTLAAHLAFFLPVADVLPEEIAFRAVLLGALTRTVPVRPAIVAAGAIFALWHVSIVAVTVDLTTLQGVWAIPSGVGALLVLFVGGVLLAWLRLRTRTIATTITAHWAFNAVVLAGLWSARLPSL